MRPKEGFWGRRAYTPPSVYRFGLLWGGYTPADIYWCAVLDCAAYVGLLRFCHFTQHSMCAWSGLFLDCLHTFCPSFPHESIIWGPGDPSPERRPHVGVPRKRFRWDVNHRGDHSGTPTHHQNRIWPRKTAFQNISKLYRKSSSWKSWKFSYFLDFFWKCMKSLWNPYQILGFSLPHAWILTRIS